MRIIKEGSVEEKEVTVKCKKCQTEFAYTNSDIKADWRDGDYVVCPKCGGFIGANRIPQVTF